MKTDSTSLVTHHLLLYGNDPSSYLFFQEGVETYFDAKLGLIGFIRMKWSIKSVIVFSNPLAPEENWEELTAKFLKEYKAYNIVFIGVGEKYAVQLKTFGYYINKFGETFNIDLNEFHLKGKQNRHLRGAINQASTIKVLEQSVVDIDVTRMLEISESWMSMKPGLKKELRVLTRPPVFTDEWEVRKFFAYQDSKMIGYVFFDPYFYHGKVVGYLANILRRDPRVHPASFLDKIIVQAALKFKDENVKELSLGLAPLANIGAYDGDILALRRGLQFLYNSGGKIYNFRGLHFHKTRYPSVSEDYFICSKGLWKSRPLQIVASLGLI